MSQPEAVRGVRMHEYLMSGGKMLGYKDGIMQYSGPVSPETDPVCPWHERDCEAWEAIKEGRGYWTALEAELEAIMADATHEANEERIAEILTLLEGKPRDIREVRERSDEEIARDRAWAEGKKATQPKAKSKPKQYDIIGSFDYDRDELEDARDVVADELGFEPVPDEIEIDGSEEDED